MLQSCCITMVSKLLKVCDLTLTGLGNMKIWAYMVAVYTNGLGLIKIYHN